MCIILIMLIDVWSSEMCEELVEREFCSGFINHINGLIDVSWVQELQLISC